MGLVFSVPVNAITETYRDSDNVIGGAAGNHEVNLPQVPEGEVWIIEAATAFCGNQTISHVSVRLYDDASAYMLSGIAPSAANDAAQLYAPVMLFPGEGIRGWFTGCAAGVNVFVYAVGLRLSLEIL